MKQWIYLCTLIFCFNSFAQGPQRHEKMTPEQHANLQSKKMQLILDLSDDKTAKIAQILTAHFETSEQQRKANKNGSQYEKRMDRVTLEIALKKELQKLLPPAALEKWEKMKKKKRKGKAKPPRNEKNRGPRKN